MTKKQKIINSVAMALFEETMEGDPKRIKEFVLAFIKASKAKRLELYREGVRNSLESMSDGDLIDMIESLIVNGSKSWEEKDEAEQIRDIVEDYSYWFDDCAEDDVFEEFIRSME